MAVSSGLLDPAQPSFLTIDCDDAALGRLYLELIERYSRATVRLIRGKRSRKAAGFLDEAAAAFQLPLYFGGGWNGFEECLRQYWLPTDGIIGVVAGAGLLLADDTESAWAALVSILKDARDAPGPPVRLILQANPQDTRRLRARIESHGGRLAELRFG